VPEKEQDLKKRVLSVRLNGLMTCSSQAFLIYVNEFPDKETPLNPKREVGGLREAKGKM